MSQREGQIYVCVKDHSMWERLYDLEIQDDWWLNAKTGKGVFDGVQGNVWYIDGDWSPSFGNGFVWLSGMGSFVHAIYDRLGKDNCVILGSLTDINTDPFEWIYYCLGGYPEQRSVSGICGGPHIYDVDEWLEWARIDLKPQELRHLARFAEMTEVVKRISPVKRLSPAGGNERRGRMFISVKDPAQWAKAKGLKLTDISFAFPGNISRQLSETIGLDFVLDKDWHIDYGYSDVDFPLKQIVSKLKQRLGSKECVILAECADPDVSPVYKIACCVDGSLDYKEVLAPLSDVAINDVQGWLRLAGYQFNKKKREYMQDFPSSVFDFARPTGKAAGRGAAKVDDRLKGLTFVVTGDVYRFKSRQELKLFVESHGGKLASDVTAKTSFLITNSPNSGTSKNVKARSFDVPIISEADFLDRFGS